MNEMFEFTNIISNSGLCFYKKQNFELTLMRSSKENKFFLNLNGAKSLYRTIGSHRMLQKMEKKRFSYS